MFGIMSTKLQNRINKLRPGMNRKAKGDNASICQDCDTDSEVCSTADRSEISIKKDSSDVPETMQPVEGQVGCARKTSGKADTSSGSENKTMNTAPSDLDARADHGLSVPEPGLSQHTSGKSVSVQAKHDQKSQELAEELDRLNKTSLTLAEVEKGLDGSAGSDIGGGSGKESSGVNKDGHTKDATSPSAEAGSDIPNQYTGDHVAEQSQKLLERLLNQTQDITADSDLSEDTMKIYAGVKALHYDMLSLRYRHLNSTYENLRTDHQKLQLRYQDLESNVTVLQAANDILQNHNDELRRYTAENSRLRSQIDGLTEDNECLRLTDVHRGNHATKLRADVEQERREKVRLQAMIDDLSKQNVQLHMRVSSLSSGSSMRNAVDSDRSVSSPSHRSHGSANPGAGGSPPPLPPPGLAPAYQPLMPQASPNINIGANSIHEPHPISNHLACPPPSKRKMSDESEASPSHLPPASNPTIQSRPQHFARNMMTFSPNTSHLSPRGPTVDLTVNRIRPLPTTAHHQPFVAGPTLLTPQSGPSTARSQLQTLDSRAFSRPRGPPAALSQIAVRGSEAMTTQEQRWAQ